MIPTFRPRTILAALVAAGMHGTQAQATIS
jgi:hypothetical protein